MSYGQIVQLQVSAHGHIYTHHAKPYHTTQNHTTRKRTYSPRALSRTARDSRSPPNPFFQNITTQSRTVRLAIAPARSPRRRRRRRRQHARSGKFLTAVTQAAALEPENMALTLTAGGSLLSQFRLTSRYKYKKRGDGVCFNESVLIESMQVHSHSPRRSSSFHVRARSRSVVAQSRVRSTPPPTAAARATRLVATARGSVGL